MKSRSTIITGTFDWLHPGHIAFVYEALQLGEKVIAIIARDSTLLQHRKFSPDHNENIRKQNLEKLFPQIQVILGDENDPFLFIEKYNPHYILLGYDQTLFTDALEAEIKKRKLRCQVRRAQALLPDISKSSRIRSIVQDPNAFFVISDKPDNMPSNVMKSVVRRYFPCEKIGFSGTLDFFASGMMIFATGRATRLLDIFHLLPKTYEAEFVLGATSNTDDAHGDIESTFCKKYPTKDEIKNILKTFVGKQKQAAPLYSALKVQGKRMSDHMREGNVIKHKSRDVEILHIELLEYKEKSIRIRAEVNSGTYIRSIARDLGKLLGCAAYCHELRRTKIGPWKLDSSQNWGEYFLQLNVFEAQDTLNQYFANNLSLLQSAWKRRDDGRKQKNS